MRYRNYKSLKFITIALTLQNFICLLASNLFPEVIGKFIILYKEVIFWGIAILSLIEKKKIEKNLLPMTLFILYLCMCMFSGNASVYTKLVCFRQLMTPIILVLYGRSLRLSRIEKQGYMRFIVDFGIFQAIFGLIERCIFGDSFWLKLNVSNIFRIKGFSDWVFGGLPGNYYSADFYHIIGKTIRRLVGIMTDPLLTAHFLAFCIVILLFTDCEKKTSIKYTKLVLITVACILTISKGAYLIIGIAYLYKLWKQNRGVAIGGICLVIMSIIVIIQSNLFRTVAIHLAGFSTGIANLSLFGGGVGTAGNLASLSGSSSTSGESFFGMVLGQIGIVGMILFIWSVYCLGKCVLKNRNGKYEYAIVAYIMAVMIEALVSESAINFVGSGCAFIILGYFTTRSKEEFVRQKEMNRNTIFLKNEQVHI